MICAVRSFAGRGLAPLLLAWLGSCSQPAETQAQRAEAAAPPSIAAAGAADDVPVSILMRERAVFAAG